MCNKSRITLIPESNRSLLANLHAGLVRVTYHSDTLLRNSERAREPEITGVVFLSPNSTSDSVSDNLQMISVNGGEKETYNSFYLVNPLLVINVNAIVLL